MVHQPGSAIDKWRLDTQNDRISSLTAKPCPATADWILRAYRNSVKAATVPGTPYPISSKVPSVRSRYFLPRQEIRLPLKPTHQNTKLSRSWTGIRNHQRRKRGSRSTQPEVA